MKNRMTAYLAILTLHAAILSENAQAQIDPGNFQIFQRGIEVGRIYVPLRSASCQYVEHWYLFSNYTYPSARNPVSLLIKPGAKPFADIEKFKASMREFDPRGTHIEVAATEHRQKCER